MIKKVLSKLTVFQKQVLTGVIFGSVFIVVILFILVKVKSHPAIVKKVEVTSESEHVKSIESVGDQINPEEMWRYKMQEQNESLKKELSNIKEEMVKATAPRNDSEIENLKGEITQLKTLMEGAAVNQETAEVKTKSGISKIKISLTDAGQDKKAKYKDDTIPAGSFAKAVLLGGVDASTALSSSSDPRPILLRLIDAGTLPRKFRSDLEDCHIVASGYGDLSSERVFARLERLTCIERITGEVVETEVSGYIAGEDGRAGIKGVVIEKGRGYLAKSILGGILQGIAGVLNPEQSVISNSAGAFMPKRTEKEKFSQGAMAGTGSSMDRLSKYYIERAESIQPVIQVASGRIVDAIFSVGADIGTSKLKIKEEKDA